MPPAQEHQAVYSHDDLQAFFSFLFEDVVSDAYLNQSPLMVLLDDQGRYSCMNVHLHFDAGVRSVSAAFSTAITHAYNNGTQRVFIALPCHHDDERNKIYLSPECSIEELSPEKSSKKVLVVIEVDKSLSVIGGMYFKMFLRLGYTSVAPLHISDPEKTLAQFKMIAEGLGLMRPLGADLDRVRGKFGEPSWEPLEDLRPVIH